MRSSVTLSALKRNFTDAPHILFKLRPNSPDSLRKAILLFKIFGRKGLSKLFHHLLLLLLRLLF
jgi:hypothetical protein